MLLGELRDSIAHKWGDGNNFALQSRIQLAIVAAHATIIERRYPSISRVPDILIKTIRSLDLVRVNAEDFPLGNSSFTILRTVNQIPDPITFKDGSMFSFIGPLTYPRGFSYIPFEQVADIKERRFSSREIFATFYENYILTINYDGYKIRTRYVPDNIVEFKDFSTPANSDTIDDENIDIPDVLVEGIEALVEERRFKVETGKEDAEINLNG
jgi:hypothetical protein